MRGKYKVTSDKTYVHRIIAAKALGRPLLRDEIVHHVDGDKSNNDSSNLVICQGQVYHLLLHARQRVVDHGEDPDTHKYCSYHKRVEPREDFSTRPSSYDGLHNTCREATNEYRRDRGDTRGKFNWRQRLMQQYRRAKKSNKEVSWL